MVGISVIICSRDKCLVSRLRLNLSKTIGCDHEIIIVDNSDQKFTIFEAYNRGLSKSLYPFLVFVHEDVVFHTPNWGGYLISFFEENEKVGLLGVAGSKVKTEMPSAWWDCPFEQQVVHIVQHLKGKKEKELWNFGFGDNEEEEVVVIDGVFIGMRRVSNIYFNEKFKGFHNYDLNISLEFMKKGFMVMVTNKITIEHFSLGTLSKEWYLSALDFSKHYRKILPVLSEDSKQFRMRALEIENGERFTEALLSHGLKKQGILLWLRLFIRDPFSRFHFYFLKSYIRAQCWLL